ncbi:MAG TPA: hypothetical protein VHD33_01250 [Legionellaceae bacterium]|nr:hypothetical protein [Legionellaceae bacterium]
MYPTYYEYIVMSRLAYQHEKLPADYEENIKYLSDLGWTSQEITPGSEVSGYVGIIFTHIGKKQCVIAHAGTMPERSATLRADAEGIVGRKPDPLLLDALTLPQKQREEVQRLLSEGYTLSFTGHSLGGFLAELSVYACLRRWGLSSPEVSAVTFDSPGSIEVMEYWQSDISAEKIDLSRLNIIGFLSSPNLVNTFYRHPGSVYRLVQPVKNEKGKKQAGVLGFKKYLLDSHDLPTMMELFDKGTGLPKEKVCFAMKNWPLADYQELFDLKNRPIFGSLDWSIRKSLEMMSNLANTFVNALLWKSRKPHAIVTLFGGGKLNSLQMLLESQDDYHPKFDIHTQEGLKAVIETGYEIQEPNDSLTHTLARHHFPETFLEFAKIHMANKDLEFYKDYLVDRGLETHINNLGTFRIDDKYVHCDEGIIHLKNSWLQMCQVHQTLLPHFKESYEAAKTEQLSKDKQKLNEHMEEMSKIQKRLDISTTENKQRYQQELSRLEDEQKALKKNIRQLETTILDDTHVRIYTEDCAVTTGTYGKSEAYYTGAADEINKLRNAPLSAPPAGYGIFCKRGSLSSGEHGTAVTRINLTSSEGMPQKQG